MNEVIVMLLCSLEIKNYGYWKDLQIPFADKDGNPYPTILLHGEQNSGKSSIVRSLRWLMYGDLWEPPVSKFPNSWKGEFKETQYVRASFSTPTEKIVATRTRSPGKGMKNTTVQLSRNGKQVPDHLAVVSWERIFGKLPLREDDVEFFIRVQQMTKTAETIATSDYQDRLLSFSNCKEMIERMEKARQDIQKEFSNATTDSTNPTAAAELNRLIQRRNDLSDEIQKEQEELTKTTDRLDGLVANEDEHKKNVDQEEQISSVKAEIVKQKMELTLARSQFKQKFNLVYSQILYGLMEKKGVEKNLPSRLSVMAKAYDVEAFLDEFEDYISDESIDAIKKITSDSSNQNAVTLLNAKDMKPEIEIICSKLNNSFLALDKAESNLLVKQGELTASKSDVRESKLTLQEIINLAEKKSNLSNKITLLESDYSETDDKITEQQTLLTEAEGSGEKAKLLSEEAEVAQNIINCIKKAESTYLSVMFNKQMESISQFWKEIDADHSKSDIIYDSEAEKIRLKDKLTDEWVDLKYSDSDGGASSGQFETALLCMALARAQQTGLGLPIFMDDAMGDMDANHKGRAIVSAAKKFGQVIFVTNTPATVRDHINVDFELETTHPKSDKQSVQHKEVKP